MWLKAELIPGPLAPPEQQSRTGGWSLSTLETFGAEECGNLGNAAGRPRTALYTTLKEDEPLQPLHSLAMMHFSSCIVPRWGEGPGRKPWLWVLQLLCTKTYTPPVNADFYKH